MPKTEGGAGQVSGPAARVLLHPPRCVLVGGPVRGQAPPWSEVKMRSAERNVARTLFPGNSHHIMKIIPGYQGNFHHMTEFSACGSARKHDIKEFKNRDTPMTVCKPLYDAFSQNRMTENFHHMMENFHHMMEIISLI